MRPRKSNPHNLPPGMHIKHNAFYWVSKGKWTRLASLDERTEAFEKYGKLTGPKKSGGMVELINRAYKLHTSLRSKRTGEHLSEQTKASYDSARKRLIEVFEEFEPSQIKPKHVARLRLKDSETPGAANRNQIFLRIVFKYALQEGLVDSNPCLGQERLIAGRRTRYLTNEEFDKILSAAGPRLRVIMKLCYLTGQRIGNILKIKFEHLGEEGISFGRHKTSQALIVKWSAGLREAVQEAESLLTDGKISLIRKGPLLRGERAGKRHKAPSYHTVLEQWWKACEKAEVLDVTPHDLRAKSATDAEKQGINPQELLDHADRKTTEGYLRDPEVPRVQGPSFRRVLDK